MRPKSGCIHIYTGDGKGKTTAALGLALRASGAGLHVAIYQFFKGGVAESGEIAACGALGKEIELVVFEQLHPFFEDNLTDKKLKDLKDSVAEGLERARKKMLSGKVDMVILDEILNGVSANLIDEEMLLSLLGDKPQKLELILTGRGASPRLIKKADYVTEMKMISHPYYKGAGPRRGIEY